MPSARSTEQRLADTRRRLASDVDAWFATADPAGGPYMIPLSYLWEGGTLLIATPAASRTSRNLQADPRVRVGVGGTRDVVMVDGTAATVPLADLPDDLARAFAAHTGFDPRDGSDPYLWFRIAPVRLQAWREANELSGRTLVRDGRWVDEPDPKR
jgi:hypothetical protein